MCERVRVIFVMISIFGLFYFLFRKRIFDFFSLAFISSCIYFMPGYLGYSMSPIQLNVKIGLVDQTYVVMISVLVSIIISAVFYDLTNNSSKKTLSIKSNDNGLFIKFTVLLSLISFCLMIVTTGDLIFNNTKAVVLDSVNRYHTLWAFSTMIWIVLSYLKRNYILLLIGLCFLSFDVFIGFRSKMAVALIALLTIYLNRQGKQLIIRKWKFILFSFIIAMFFFVYKKLHAVIKLDRWDIVSERLKSLDFYLSSITTSEPFITQTILNEILVNNFRVGINHLYSTLQLILPINPFNYNVKSFHELYQPALFPQVNYGLANNIWGEMYSLGGWFFILIFLIIFNVILYFGSYLMYRSNEIIITITSLIMVYWAFYIHRNSLFYELNLIKTFLLIAVILVFISYFVASTIKRKNSKNKKSMVHK